MRRFLVSTFLASFSLTAFAATEPRPLLRRPAVNRTHIVFSYAGDLWSVPRSGGTAVRLTSGTGVETDPYFSPDGSRIAFTGDYDGNTDVYVMPAAGGVPRRVTFHPSIDIVQGWSSDGTRILFRSARGSHTRSNNLFTIAPDGVFPDLLPLPMAEEGWFSPDGSKLAYMPLARAFDSWKRYRGGRMSVIWIATLSDSSIEKIPRDNTNDFNPMWVDHRIFFLSDRQGAVTLFVYDTRTKKVAPALVNDSLDIRSASLGPDAIVYERFGEIWLYDIKSGKARKVDIRIAADLPEVRPRLVKTAANIRGVGLSPTGARALFEARGEIFTVPAEKGHARNLTQTTGVAERFPAWSPDGRWIAYFSDATGEYELHVRAQGGAGEVRKFNLGAPSFYDRIEWSPDSKKIAYTGKSLRVWYLDLEKKTPVLVDQDLFQPPDGMPAPKWSPDSRWLAYTKYLPSHMRAIYCYSLETGQARQATDGMSFANDLVFDASGKYLFFTASTNIGPVVEGTMWSLNRPVSSTAYVLVLRQDLPSPLAPESDEEKDKDKAAPANSAKDKEPPRVSIDFDRIGRRILALPLPARNYRELVAGKAGMLFLIEGPNLVKPVGFSGVNTLQRFDLSTRKTTKLAEGIGSFALSANGEKMLVRQGAKTFIGSSAAALKPGEGEVRLEGVEMWLDPRQEWKQMFRESLRIQRDFFYDPNLHGLDLKALEREFAPYLDTINTRAELNYLFSEMYGRLSVGHLYIVGGDMPAAKAVPGGLLGADYRIENGRYRFARVFDGESWSPQLSAPLAPPGVNVVEGEYLLAVNGRDIMASGNLYQALEATANKSVLLRVGPNPSNQGSREVTVVPAGDEKQLRYTAWVEDNRRLVDQLSNGRLAYMHLPDTSSGAYANFTRWFFAQAGKQGVIVDERFNSGGLSADYVIDYLGHALLNYRTTREGRDMTTPIAGIFGPKAMLINEYAGSGGDSMPWYFRRAKLGPLIGKRTWGGLVGFYAPVPRLIDGGAVSAPNRGFWTPEGQWEVENFGVAPDIEVEYDPRLARQGYDPQLEKAVAVLLDELKKNPPPVHRKPPYPKYQ
jgi:tricorn protease